MHVFFKAACALATTLLIGTASATPVIDQSQTESNGGFCYMETCGQSFQQSASNIAGAGVYLAPSYNPGVTSALTISIYSTISGAAGSLLATGSVTGVTSTSGWVNVFWTPVAVAANTTYYMLLDAPALVAAFSSPSDYTKGSAVFSGNEWTGYDLAFRTYSDAAAAVPEPVSLGLIGIGLLGLGMSRRRKAA